MKVKMSILAIALAIMVISLSHNVVYGEDIPFHLLDVATGIDTTISDIWQQYSVYGPHRPYNTNLTSSINSNMSEIMFNIDEVNKVLANAHLRPE